MRPIPRREIQENEGDGAREDLDEHGEDFDADWDRAQAYNDYLREIEA